MELPLDLQIRLGAMPLRAVMFACRKLFGCVWDRLWNEPLPDPADAREYTVAWQPPLVYEDAKRFYLWLATGERQWVFVGPGAPRIIE